jgi:hypothetical protein
MKDPLIEQLKHAAGHIGELSENDLQALLLKAVERLSEAEMDAEYLALIREMNEAGQQPISANDALKDWLIGQGRIAVLPIDEETETRGNA